MTDSGARGIHIGGDSHGPNITGDGNTINIGPDRRSTATQHFAGGVQHLRLGLYSKALAEFGQSMDGDPANPDVYYLSAVATLGGRKAFLASLEQIRAAEKLIRAALDLEDRAVFHCFLAYLSFDYYHRKSLRAPTPWGSSLERAIRQGLTRDDIESLFTLLSVDNPWRTDP